MNTYDYIIESVRDGVGNKFVFRVFVGFDPGRPVAVGAFLAGLGVFSLFRVRLVVRCYA